MEQFTFAGLVPQLVRVPDIIFVILIFFKANDQKCGQQ
jgi:hypothetical protein